MKTIKELLLLSTQFLEEKGVPSARRQVEELLSYLLQMKRLDLYLHFDQPVEEKEVALLRSFIKRKAQREPWQYIVGEVEFLDLPLSLTPAVLIPRPETEILATEILKEVPEGPLEVWDVCCGSGCLGLSLKKARPHWNVTLSDLSSDALAVAQQNAESSSLFVTFLHGDLLTPFHGKKADVVVCNPPYIAEEEFAQLDPEVKTFEPKQALVAGKSGLEFYERLARELPAFLKPGARLFFEMGTGQGEKVKALFAAPYWVQVEVRPDWAGHDRFFSAVFV